MGRLTGKKVFDYLIQLSVVILGIFITLTATNYFTKRAKVKEYRQVVDMVYAELVGNKTYIDNKIAELENELEMMNLLYMHRDSLHVVPADTIWKYQYLHQGIDFPVYTDHAFEVMKFSSSIHSSNDVAIIRDIMEAYDNIIMCNTYFNKFYESKDNFICEVIEEVGDLRTNYVNEVLRAHYSTRSMEHFLSTTFYRQIIEYTSELSDGIGRIIKRLESKYRIQETYDFEFYNIVRSY